MTTAELYEELRLVRELLHEARLCTRAHALILTTDAALRERGLKWMQDTDALLGLAPSGIKLSARRRAGGEEEAAA